MGFTNFLGRKPHQKQQDVAAFKAQAYGSTIESLPPVLGTHPIPGNGVNAIGSNGIHQLPRKKSTPRLPISMSRTSFRSITASPTISVASAAPAPFAYQTQSPSTLGRPNTAPDDPSDPAFQQRPKSSGKARSRRDSLRHSVVFLRKTGSQGHVEQTDTSTISNGPINAPPVPPIPAAHSPAPTGSGRFPRSDAASMTLSTAPSLSDSLNRGAGFVDILDAQGQIRPSNFRSRLQATGARDYGEDVAERNMAVNRFTLSNSPGTPYYATSSQPSVPGSQPSKNVELTSQRPRTVNFPKRVDSFDATVTVKNVRQHESQQTTGDAEREARAHQRRSVVTSSSRHRPHALNLQPSSPTSSEDAAEPPEIPRTRPTSIVSIGRQGDNDLQSILGIRNPSTVPQNPSRWPLTADLASPTLQVPARLHTNDFRLHRKDKPRKGRTIRYNGLGELAVESTADAYFTSAAPAPAVPAFFRSSDYPSDHMSNIDKARSKSAHAPRRGGRGRSNSRPSSSSSVPGNTYPRTRSLGGLSLPPRPNLDDITEHIPARTSSRRNWSISSSTPPASASDWSSDLFQRPHSRHTADTSIPPSGSVRSLTLGSLKEALYASHPQAGDELPTYYNIDDDEPRSPAAIAGEIMNRLMESKRKEQEKSNLTAHDDELGNASDSSKLQEETLLFHEDGFGDSGGCLPGLFDGRASPAPSEWSVQTMTYDQALDLITPGGLRPPNTPSQKTTFGALPCFPTFETSSNDGGSDATSEGGLDPKLDAKMAMKVRRELKRRTRIATLEKRHGKQPAYNVPNAAQCATAPTSNPQRV